MIDPTSRTERIIAEARLVLATAAMGLTAAAPEQISQNPDEAYSVVALYLLYSIAVIWIIDRKLMRIERVGLCSQVADTLWFPIILLYTQDENSPLVLYYVYSLITASYRWGFKETLLINTANVALYFVVHLVTAGTQLEFHRFWVGPTYLYVLACLIGYLGEHQKRIQRQLISLAEMPRSIGIKSGFSRMLEEAMSSLRRLFRAEQCIVVLRDVESGQFFVRKAGAGIKRGSYRLGGLPPTEMEFLCAPRSNVGYLVNPHKKLARVFGLRAVMVYDFDQQKMVLQAFQPDPRLSSIFEMESMLSVPIFLGAEFRGRVYLVNRARENFSLQDLRYLQLVVSQLAPLLENFRLLQQTQRVSILEEKNRIARDLHDGLLQSLASLDLRIEVFRKLLQEAGPEVQRELQDLQKIVRDEHSEMRSYMKRLKTPAFAGDQLYEALHDYLRAFERETGLKVLLSWPARPVHVHRNMGREMYQIIHEALTNVRKHAEAHQVEIRLTQQDGAIRLVIGDDGRGFPAASGDVPGRVGSYPWSIQERTRTLNGSLHVESNNGKGARLTIEIPLG